MRSEFLYQMKKISGLVSKTCAIGKKSQIQYCSDFSSPNIYLCQRSMNIAVDSGPLDTEKAHLKSKTSPRNPILRHCNEFTGQNTANMQNDQTMRKHVKVSDFGSCHTLLCIKEGGEGSSAEDVCDLRIFKADRKC